MFDNLVAKYHDIVAKRERGEGGFTLIELLVVVVIIGILIAIAIPLYLNYQKGAKDKSAESDLKAAVTAVQQCYTDFGSKYPGAGDQSGNEMTFWVGTTSVAATNCKTTAQTSDGTTMTYFPLTNGFALSAQNSNGSGKEYSYNSTTAAGGVIK